MDWEKIQHIIRNDDGSEIELSQEGEVAGFRAGDRIRYSDRCYQKFRGRTATVVGFDAQQQIWTQPDGGTGCTSTRADYATNHLIKIV